MGFEVKKELKETQADSTTIQSHQRYVRTRDDILEATNLTDSEISAALGAESNDRFLGDKALPQDTTLSVGDVDNSIRRLGSGIMSIGSYLTELGSIRPEDIARSKAFVHAASSLTQMQPEQPTAVPSFDKEDTR